MKSLFFIPMFVLLSGCQPWFIKTETKYIDREIYVVRQAPTDMYSVPVDASPINVDTATQRDVAKWVAERDRQIKLFQKKIKSLKEFYDRPIQEDEKKSVEK